MALAKMGNDLSIGERVKELRTKMGLSQKELGEALGVGNTAIAKWESRGSVPSEYLAKLSGELGCSVDYLLGLPAVGAGGVSPTVAVDVLQKLIRDTGEVLELRRMLAEAKSQNRTLIQKLAATAAPAGQSEDRAAAPIRSPDTGDNGEGEPTASHPGRGRTKGNAFSKNRSRGSSKPQQDSATS